MVITVKTVKTNGNTKRETNRDCGKTHRENQW